MLLLIANNAKNIVSESKLAMLVDELNQMVKMRDIFSNNKPKTSSKIKCDLIWNDRLFS